VNQPEFGSLQFRDEGSVTFWKAFFAGQPDECASWGPTFGYSASSSAEVDTPPHGDQRVCNSLSFSVFLFKQSKFIGPALMMPEGWVYAKAALNGPTVTMHFKCNGEPVEADFTMAVHFTGKPPCAAADSVEDYHVVPAKIVSEQKGLWMVSPKQAELALTKSLLVPQRECLLILKALAKSMDTYMWSSYAAKCVVAAEATRHPVLDEWSGEVMMGVRLLSMLHALARAAKSEHLASPILPGLNAWKSRLSGVAAMSAELIEQIADLAECLAWEGGPDSENPFKELIDQSDMELQDESSPC